MIPFVDLKSQYTTLKPKIQARIDQVLEHGQYIMGPEVRELEEKLADYAGAKHCITVSSGTEALLISLMALGVGPGDEVITTPFTFIATAEVVALLGATPVFADIEVDTCNIDAGKIEEVITPKTKAIIPVSIFGQPADMDEINAIAEKHGGIPVIEDGAQSFGAVYKGKKSCSLSFAGCTSFFPSKPLGCYGDGGAIFTSDDGFAEVCREIRVHGQKQRYVHSRVGVGGRMDTIQCAIVLAKLSTFEDEVAKRNSIGALYNDLVDANGISRVCQKSDRTSVFAQYTIFVSDRDAFQERAKLAGIPTAIHYPMPLHTQPVFSYLNIEGSSYPNAVRRSREVLSLPMHPFLDLATINEIVAAIA